MPLDLHAARSLANRIRVSGDICRNHLDFQKGDSAAQLERLALNCLEVSAALTPTIEATLRSALNALHVPRELARVFVHGTPVLQASCSAIGSNEIAVVVSSEVVELFGSDERIGESKT